MKWQSTWKYFVRSAAVALVHPCTRDISAPARHFKANPQDSGFSGRRGHGWTRGCGRRNPQLRRGALYTDVLRPSAITPGAFGTWRQNRRERILNGRRPARRVKYRDVFYKQKFCKWNYLCCGRRDAKEQHLVHQDENRFISTLDFY